MTVFKKENPMHLFESMKARRETNVGMLKHLRVRRCKTCGLLFQVFGLGSEGRYTCALCRYETIPAFKEKVKENNIKRYGAFSEKEFYAHAIKVHKELQRRKDNINHAYKVTTVCAPRCTRDLTI